MDCADRRQQFRAILSGRRCIHPGSVFDPISARIAEDLGFELGMLAGSTASLTVLGAPDLIVLTLTELAEQAYRICRASRLPLLVDADHGYGNALSVKRTVEELEAAGIAGLTIEDTWLPARFAEGGASSLIAIGEGVGKMRAALEGRQDPGLVIIARTGAIAITGLADALARIKAYVATGVDAIFLVGLRTREQLEAVASEIDVPIILGNVPAELSDLGLLSANGVRVCLQGHLPIMAAVRAVHETLEALRGGTAPRDIGGVASDELMKAVTRDASYKRWAREFLGHQ